jgi:hypothetical protein
MGERDRFENLDAQGRDQGLRGLAARNKQMGGIQAIHQGSGHIRQTFEHRCRIA